MLPRRKITPSGTLSINPPERSSTPRTSKPITRQCRARCDPMKPATPVISTLVILKSASKSAGETKLASRKLLPCDAQRYNFVPMNPLPESTLEPAAAACDLRGSITVRELYTSSDRLRNAQRERISQGCKDHRSG